MPMKQNLTILWLDDQRDPLKYFRKKDEKGEGTLHDNLIYYANLSKQYNLNFVWVKNYKEFVNYIQQNGMPKFISFDHDLSKTSLPTDPKGLDCAKWLVNYCKKNGIQMPMTYVHSANPKWRGVIRDVLAGKMVAESKTIKINENQLKSLIRESIENLIMESSYLPDEAYEEMNSAKSHLENLLYILRSKNNKKYDFLKEEVSNMIDTLIHYEY